MSVPLRVLIATDSFPPRCGGSGWSTWELVRGLIGRGHHVDVVKIETGSQAGISEDTYESVPVTTFRVSAPNVPFVRNVVKNERLWRQFADYLISSRLSVDARPDIIHAQHVMTTVPAIRAGAAADIPVVATVRDYWPVCYWSDLIYDPSQPALCPACSAGMMTTCVRPRAGAAWPASLPLIPYMRTNLRTKRRTLARASAIIAVSSAIANDLRTRAPEIAGTAMHTIPNPVDMTALDDVRLSSVRLLDGPYVLYAGKLATNKGVQFLLPAIASAGIRWPVVVAGDGPLRGALEQEARARGIDLRVLGWRDRQEVWAWMRHATLLAFPSYGPESLSRVLIEAAALGVPIAAMNTGGTADILEHGTTGLLSSDQEGFAQDLVRLAGDEPLRHALGAAARRAVLEKFSTPSVVERVEQVYLSAIGDGRSAIESGDRRSADRLMSDLAIDPSIIQSSDRSTDHAIERSGDRPIADRPIQSPIAHRRSPILRVAVVARAVRPLHGFGGLERSVHDLVRHLANRGVEVTLIVPPPTVQRRNATDPFESTRIRVRHVPYLTFPLANRRGTTVLDRSTAYLLYGLRAGRLALSLARAGEVDVIHGFGAAALGAAVKDRPVPLAINPQGLEEFGATAASQPLLKRVGYTPLRWAVRKTTRSAECIIATDVALEPTVTRHLRPRPGQVRTIPNGIDLLEASRLAGIADGALIRRRHGLPPEMPVLLSVGRIEFNKGFDVLATALGHSVERGTLPATGWKWVIVGGGPYRPELERRIAQYRIDSQVLFAGRTTEEELHAWYEAATVFVHPTRYEGSSLVTLEAMAHRRAVIATTAGGLPDKVMPGVNGWLVPPEDVGGLAAAIAVAIEHPMRLLEMGQRSREIVEREFSWAVLVERQIALYGELLASKKT